MGLITGNESKIFAKGVIGNVRKAQEDSNGYRLGTPNGDLFVVCDGMGGHVGGAMASGIAVDSIVNYIASQKYPTPVEAMDGALQFANTQILGHATNHPEYKGMGTTACILLLNDDGAWIAHVGDSRIYLYLAKERVLHRITKDHSYVQTLVDAGEITDDQAEHHPNKNRILKALGILPELSPTFNFESRPIHPKNGDIFLICSDGLSGMIPDRTIEAVLGENITLHEKGEHLIELAMIGETVKPGGQDNCTLQLIEIDSSNWMESQFHSFNPQPTPQPAHQPFSLTSSQQSHPPLQQQSHHYGNPQDGDTHQSSSSAQSNSGKSRKKIFLPLAVIVVAAVLIAYFFGSTASNARKAERIQQEIDHLQKDSVKYNDEYNKMYKQYKRLENLKNTSAEKIDAQKKCEEYKAKYVVPVNDSLSELRRRLNDLKKNKRDVDIPETEI